MVVGILLAGHCPKHARLMLKSVKDVLKCEVIQMTDEDTPELPGVDRVIRRKRTPLMLFRFEHILALPDSDHTELLLLDSDVLVKRDVSDVFQRDFDVALTRRSEPELQVQPYNTGVMFSKNAQAFWRDCLLYTHTYTGEYKEWWGDQFAVRDVAQDKPHKILTLDCDEFNWTPQHPGDSSDARIWHYKGMRKHWMGG
jgi:hypothetical protein